MKKPVFAILTAATALFVVALTVGKTEYHNRCLEQDLWFECLAALPASAKGTAEWPLLVDNCQIKAERQSVTSKEKITEGCLW